MNLGNLALDRGDYAQPRRKGTARGPAPYEESEALWQALGDRAGVARTRSALGSLATGQGDYTGAQALHTESLAIWRALEIPSGIAYALAGLGGVAAAQGDSARARGLYAESLAVVQALDARRGIEMALAGLGVLLTSTAREDGVALVRAGRVLSAAAALRDSIGAVPPPQGRRLFDQAVALVRAALVEEMFVAVWAAGQALSLADAVALLLGEAPPNA